MALAVSADGATILTGTPYDLNGGSIALFRESARSWSQVLALNPPDATQYDYGFGYSVAVSADGGRFLIGDPFKVVSSNRGVGTAYFYDGQGNLITELTGDPTDCTGNFFESTCQNFGYSVAISDDGTRALIGVPQATVAGGSLTGEVVPVAATGGNYTAGTSFTATDSAAYDYFGYSVAMSSKGSAELIGAPYHGQFRQGMTYLFENVGGCSGNGGQVQEDLSPSDLGNYSNYGNSVSISNNGAQALIGAPYYNNAEGTAYVFAGAPPAAEAATISILPSGGASPVGATQAFTATAWDASGNPVCGVKVNFTVTGANSISGSSVTDSTGSATFNYAGVNTGVDTITAYADNNGNGEQDAGEPGAVANWI